MNYEEQIIKAGLEIRAFNIDTKNYFTWVSGFKMPVYIDNRLFLFYPEYRELIVKAMKNLIKDMEFEIIAGVATSGIPFALLLSEELKKPMIYIRKDSKDYGLKKQIEGVKDLSKLRNKKVLLVEDLISRGTNSIPCINTLKESGAICNHILSIFNYGFEETLEKFKSINCDVLSLIYFDRVITLMKKENYLTQEEINELINWKLRPFG